ncbi:hypothetical protein [Roseomonas sp. WA12]
MVPLPWLLTSVLVAVFLLAPSLLRMAHFDIAHTAASLLFLPWTRPVMGEPIPVLVPGSASLCWSAGDLAQTVLFALAGVAVATAVSILLYRYVETPLREVMRARRVPVPQAF